jgi:hypothetical protein
MRIKREHIVLGVLSFLSAVVACSGSSGSSGGSPDSGADTDTLDGGGDALVADGGVDALVDVSDAGDGAPTAFCMEYFDSADPFEGCQARLCCGAFQTCTQNGYQCEAFKGCLTQCFADGAVGNPDPEDYCDGVCADAQPVGYQEVSDLANCSFDNCQDF